MMVHPCPYWDSQTRTGQGLLASIEIPEGWGTAARDACGWNIKKKIIIIEETIYRETQLLHQINTDLQQKISIPTFASFQQPRGISWRLQFCLLNEKLYVPLQSPRADTSSLAGGDFRGIGATYTPLRSKTLPLEILPSIFLRFRLFQLLGRDISASALSRQTRRCRAILQFSRRYGELTFWSSHNATSRDQWAFLCGANHRYCDGSCERRLQFVACPQPADKISIGVVETKHKIEKNKWNHKRNKWRGIQTWEAWETTKATKSNEAVTQRGNMKRKYKKSKLNLRSCAGKQTHWLLKIICIHALQI